MTHDPNVNYQASVFRMTSLLEKLGIKEAIYVHQDQVRHFCEKYWFNRMLDERRGW